MSTEYKEAICTPIQAGKKKKGSVGVNTSKR